MDEIKSVIFGVILIIALLIIPSRMSFFKGKEKVNFIVRLSILLFSGCISWYFLFSNYSHTLTEEDKSTLSNIHKLNDYLCSEWISDGFHLEIYPEKDREFAREQYKYCLSRK
ncbi:TPA: hypothetical protein PXM39_003591 [Yersinia enterocolitica]|nr:hypothetical protein [Yersinia enterocolitica]HDL6900984.1 hypothetical protein [Yersinia enterocolitica]HDL7092090.1 hypothetical protein [Yersinia enterocolitica]HDL7101128.1 hypothetical protein [Yersinia enterocolitica]HDL7135610.1 hypothetical protein [Yersinia enterocolitica]